MLRKSCVNKAKDNIVIINSQIHSAFHVYKSWCRRNFAITAKIEIDKLPFVIITGYFKHKTDVIIATCRYVC